MSARVKRNLSMLRWLSKANPKARKVVLRSADRDLVDCLCECALNILNGNVPLTQAQKRRLSKYKLVLRRMASGKRSSLKAKRRLIQTGGFIAGILPVVLKALTPLLLKSIL